MNNIDKYLYNIIRDVFAQSMCESFSEYSAYLDERWNENNKNKICFKLGHTNFLSGGAFYKTTHDLNCFLDNENKTLYVVTYCFNKRFLKFIDCTSKNLKSNPIDLKIVQVESII